MPTRGKKKSTIEYGQIFHVTRVPGNTIVRNEVENN